MDEQKGGQGWFDLYPHRLFWVIFRFITFVFTASILYGLFMDIRFSGLNGLSMREIFWMVLMPVVVVTIYLAPMLWRNICPLATVNLWHFSLFGRRRLSSGKPTSHQSGISMKKVHDFLRKRGLLVSASLFWLVVPARLFLFNASSSATFWMMITVFATAFVMGFLFPVKSGWCSSICPVAAAEKTYGLNPAFSFKNTRCQFYSEAQKRVLSCSGCSFNCGDVVDPEHAYWQASSNRLFHDTVNAHVRMIFLATLPAFLTSFYLIGNNIIALPSDVLWERAVFVYSFFLIMMFLSYVLYAHVKNILRSKVEQRNGPLRLEEPSVVYALYKRRLDLGFVMVIMNIIWVASSYALVYKITGKIFPLIGENALLASWFALMAAFFFVSLFSLRNGWDETPEPGHYKPSWW